MDPGSFAVKMIVLALGLVMSLAACVAAPASAASQSGLVQPKSWKAVLIAGDDQEPAFDNAVDSMAEKLVGFGVPRSSMTILKATAQKRQAATTGNIRAAFDRLDPTSPEGCFVFITSHGAPRRGLVIRRDNGFLGPRDLAMLLSGACRNRPTVVIASGCYSGSFAEGRSMPARNRVILTAARDDRSSFGCNANLRLTVFDECILDSLDRGSSWPTVMDRTRDCVAGAERMFRVGPPSDPQLSIGDGVRGLLAFPH
jgi:hypothetical protein